MEKIIERTWYVCEKYGCIWHGKVAEMLPDYHYPENNTFFFYTEEEAIKWMKTEEDAIEWIRLNHENLND